MAELADEARRGGAVVADAQCFGTSGRLALAPVADWLRTPAVRSGPAFGRPGVAGGGGAPAAPDPTRAEPARPGPRAMVDAWQRHRFFEGLSRALLAVDRPLLLTIDNLQWCDQETLSFMTFCLGLAANEPVLMVATTAGRSRPGPRGLGRPDARDGPAHRDRSRPVRGRRHGRARRGRHRERADRSRGGPAARDDGRVPALHRRGRARRRRDRPQATSWRRCCRAGWPR